MAAASIMDWLRANELERRRVIAIVLGGLAIQALTASNQRAMFMPWLDSEHPLVSPTASAFFARVPPTGAGAGGPRLASLSRFNRPTGTRIGQSDFRTPGGGTFGLAPADPIGGDFTPGEVPGGGFQTLGFQDAPGGPGPGTTPIGPAGSPAAFDAAGSVPETATWLMMLIGFFGIGSVIRRTRRLAQRQAVALYRDAPQPAEHILAE